MRILLLSTHLNTGGIVSYLYTLAKGFIGQGHQVYVVTSGGNMEETFKDIGVHLHNLNIRTKSAASPKVYSALKPLKKFIDDNKIDIVHAQTRVTQVIGQLLNRKYGIAYVSTCHGFFRPRFFRKAFPCWGKKVIAISEAVEEHLLNDFNVKKNSIALVQSGIDLEVFRKSSDDERKDLRKKLNIDDRPTIGIIARLSDVKGQDILVRAMQEVVSKIFDVQLLLIGQGKLEGLLRDLVKEYELAKYVYFIPELDKTAEYLSVLDIFVMPSRQEGLGLSVMEAQACGLAVVASNIGGIPSLIKNNETGIMVEPENVEQLAAALIDILSDEDKRKQLGQRAYIYAQEHYSKDMMIAQTLEVYKQVIL